MRPSRADLLPESLQHTLSDWDLRQSLIHAGQIMPVIRHRGEVIDGLRRVEIAKSLRLKLDYRTIDSRIEAARYLWRVHPARAYRRFAQKRATTAQLCALFGCPPSDIPSAAQARDIKRKRKPSASKDIALLTSIPIPRRVYERAKLECKRNGTNMSRMIRYYVHTLAGVHHPHPLQRDNE